MEWISVKERLPLSSGRYLFYGDEYFTPDHIGDINHYKTIKAGYWLFGDPPWVGNMQFTHWMPLPEPPKED